jgi:hypothetical protein
MRSWGRIWALNPDGSQQSPQPAGYPYWQEVSTDPTTGDNSAVWLTTLCQCLLLNLNESPFNASLGLPAAITVLTQVQPDYYVSRIQAYFAQYFASLLVSKVQSNPPVYNVAVTTLQGARIIVSVPY